MGTASRGEAWRVQILLDRGVDVNSENEDGSTGLNMAAHGGHVGSLRVLIDARADVNHQNRHGESALHNAVLQDQTRCAKLLIESKANVNLQLKRPKSRHLKKSTPLMVAAMGNNLDILKHLVEADADLN